MMPLLPEQNVEIWGGLECTINRVRDQYFDQLEFSGHRQRDGDIELFAGLGIKKLRYPILWEHHQPERNCPIRWEETDSKLQRLRRQNIDIIAGLVHHGSGPDYVELMNDSFADGLAEYAAAVASRYPWIQYYTPVNEPLTTARFCGLYGLWYPHEKNDISFCRILVNECRATLLAMTAIRSFNPDAKLVLTEDLAKIHSSAGLKYQADFENERRWISYDLLCGKVDPQHNLWDYLVENGITIGELNYFLVNPCPPDIIGVNYYLTSERYLDENTDDYPVHTHGGNGRHSYADVEAVRVGKVRPDGIHRLVSAVWERYGIPISITEVHLHCTREEQMRWLNHVWEAANALAKLGIPIIAITPWSLLGSFGWNQLLTERGGTYEPGVFDLSEGHPRPTVLAQMIKCYSGQHQFQHQVLSTPGWWERCDRALYGVDRFFSRMSPSGDFLGICGAYTTELELICNKRALKCIIIDETDCFAFDKEDDLTIWAAIRISEYMEVYRPGRPNLIIGMMGADLNGCLNDGLNLFLDGEPDYRKPSHVKRTLKQISGMPPQHLVLID